MAWEMSQPTASVDYETVFGNPHALAEARHPCVRPEKAPPLTVGLGQCPAKLTVAATNVLIPPNFQRQRPTFTFYSLSGTFDS